MAVSILLSILLKEKRGIGVPYQKGEEPWESTVYKGELVVPIPKEERRQVKDITPNYRLYRDPEVVLYADPIDVAPVEDREAEYLLAVYPNVLRLREYLKTDEIKKMKMNLIVGDTVIFKLEVQPKAAAGSLVKGSIRYIGPHPDENEGIFFGIEIDAQERMYRGKGNSNGEPYFTCGTNNAVYVAMDKIIKKRDASTTSKRSPGPTITQHPRPATRGQTSKGVMARVFDFLQLGGDEILTTGGGAGAVSTHNSKFKVGSRPGMMGSGIKGDEQLTETIQGMQYAGPEAVSRERVEEERKALEEMKSQHEQRQHHHQQHHDDYQDNEKRGQPPNLPAITEGMRMPHQSKLSPKDQHYMKGGEEGASLPSNLNDGLDDHPPNCSPHSSRRHPSPPPPTDPVPPPTDPHHQFTIGSMVCINVQKGEPLYGVLQWVGAVPGFNGAIAGVELERPLKGSTDGTWRGIRFFTCPPGRAYFCPITVLRQDTRYLDQGQVLAHLREDIESSLVSSLITEEYYTRNLYEADHSEKKESGSDTNDANLTKESLRKLQQERPQSLQDIITQQPHSFEGMIAVQQQMHTDITWYNANFDLIMQSCEELLDHLESKKESVNKVREELCQMQEVHKKDKEKLQKAKKHYNQLQKQHDSLMTSQHKLQESHDDLTTTHRQLQSSHDNLMTTQRQLQKSHDTLKATHHQLKKSHDSLVTSLQQKKEEISQLQRSFETLTTSNHQLQNAHDDLAASNHEKEEELLHLQETHQQLVQRFEQTQVELSAKQEEVTILQKKVTETENSWKISHKDIGETKTELGRGGWAEVTIGKFRGRNVAIKRLYKVLIEQKEQNEYYLDLLHREINTMSQLRHPNLLQFIGAVLDHPSGNPMIITEVMDTSLRKAYESKELTPHPSCRPVILSIMRDVAVGLNYLHCLPDPIIHRDVSSANVLLESKGPRKWKTKISDFGSAKFARAAVTKAPGAFVYSAPESLQTVTAAATLHNKKEQTTKMDSFSYGVLLCEMVTCQFPSVETFGSLLQQVKTSSPKLLHELIVSCINEEPGRRPTMLQIIEKLDRP